MTYQYTAGPVVVQEKNEDMHYKTKNKLDILKKFIQRNYKHWVKEYPTIIGAYPGEKKKGEQGTNRYSIVFLVSAKQKRPGKMIPKYYTVSIPGEGKKRIPTDVIASKKLILKKANLSDKIKRISARSSGTNGIFLIRGQRVYACTNAHVLLPEMIAAGETFFFKPISEQVQPDVLLTNKRGERSDAFLQEGVFDGIDAAIARMDDAGDVDNTLPGFGKPVGIKILQSSDQGLALKMLGSVTGKSKGSVVNTGVTRSTSIPDVFLHNLTETDIFSQPGDSGSPVFTNGLQIAGIVVGGTTADVTFIIPIKDILDFFKCSLLN